MIDLYDATLTTPLSQQESVELNDWLKETAPTPYTIFNTHGFVAAVISSPRLVASTEWFPALLGADLPERVGEDDMQNHLDLIVRMHYQIASALIHGKTYLPCIDFHEVSPFTLENISPSRQANLKQWCQGYLSGINMALNEWQALKDFNHLFFTLTTFAEDYPALASINLGANTLLTNQHNQDLGYMIEALPTLLALIYQQAQQALHTNKNPKNILNEPCSCHSGQLFKDCCHESQGALH